MKEEVYEGVEDGMIVTEEAEWEAEKEEVKEEVEE